MKRCRRAAPPYSFSLSWPSSALGRWARAKIKEKKKEEPWGPPSSLVLSLLSFLSSFLKWKKIKTTGKKRWASPAYLHLFLYFEKEKDVGRGWGRVLPLLTLLSYLCFLLFKRNKDKKSTRGAGPAKDKSFFYESFIAHYVIFFGRWRDS